MFVIELLKSVMLGIVQGVCEWLPVSSTAHILILNDLIGMSATPEFSETFFTVIQLGSILAVIVLYFERLDPFSKKKSDTEKRITRRLWGAVAIGSVPLGIIGFALDPLIETLFYSDNGAPTRTGIYFISFALIFYGVIFILLEKRFEKKAELIKRAEDITFKRAFGVGLFQTLALIPGTSRSGSTILGARLLGISRSAAAELSFFLALPAMLGAGAYKVIKLTLSGYVMSSDEAVMLLVGSAAAFVFSVLVIGFLTDFVKKHTFIPFGIYRIILGISVIIWSFFR